jgi:hypothetical protein
MIWAASGSDIHSWVSIQIVGNVVIDNVAKFAEAMLMHDKWRPPMQGPMHEQWQ